MMRYGCDYGLGLFGGGWYGMIFMLLIAALLIFIVYKLFNNQALRARTGTENSLEVLNERFARGEIDEEEYQRKKSLLIKR